MRGSCREVHASLLKFRTRKNAHPAPFHVLGMVLPTTLPIRRRDPAASAESIEGSTSSFSPFFFVFHPSARLMQGTAAEQTTGFARIFILLPFATRRHLLCRGRAYPYPNATALPKWVIRFHAFLTSIERKLEYGERTAVDDRESKIRSRARQSGGSAQCVSERRRPFASKCCLHMCSTRSPASGSGVSSLRTVPADDDQ